LGSKNFLDTPPVDYFSIFLLLLDISQGPFCFLDIFSRKHWEKRPTVSGFRCIANTKILNFKKRRNQCFVINVNRRPRVKGAAR
jgi:hypothetical protein